MRQWMEGKTEIQAMVTSRLVTKLNQQQHTMTGNDWLKRTQTRSCWNRCRIENRGRKSFPDRMWRCAENSAPIYELHEKPSLLQCAKPSCCGEVLVQRNDWTSGISFENARGDVTEKKKSQKRCISQKRRQRPDGIQHSHSQKL